MSMCRVARRGLRLCCRASSGCRRRSPPNRCPTSLFVRNTQGRAAPLHEWAAALTAARIEGFDFFDWLTAVDETDAQESPGFDLVCHLMNSTTGRGTLARVLLRTRVSSGQSPASATGLWPGAAWHERETHEM